MRGGSPWPGWPSCSSFSSKLLAYRQQSGRPCAAMARRTASIWPLPAPLCRSPRAPNAQRSRQVHTGNAGRLREDSMTPPQARATTLAKLFPSLDDQGVAYLNGLMTEVALCKGDLLFSQGDAADALYVVVKGKVGAFLREPSGKEIFIGPIGVGETVGENGIITQQPRALTVRALTNCALCQLSATGFEQFC